jgi:hypothetical protein
MGVILPIQSHSQLLDFPTLLVIVRLSTLALEVPMNMTLE